MANLPADVITEILSKLPVTSLIRFRSISKSWQSLINSHYFTTLNLNKFHKLKSNLNLILHHSSHLYAVDFPTLGNAVNLNHPLKSYHCTITLIGSCNGLLCFKNIVHDIAIWSPSLRKHRILPNLPTQRRLVRRFCASRVHGFGFDPITGDYKVVKISFFIGARLTSVCKVNLFSCRTNAWKTLPNMPYALCYVETMGVLVDHKLHWVVPQNRRLAGHYLIVAFDLRFEVFNEVPLPVLSHYFTIDLPKLGGCLCIIVNYYFENTRSDIWVMKQYGSKDSWFKLFTLVESIELPSLKYVKPLGYSSDGIKVLFQQDFNKLFWYNLKSEQVSRVTIPGMSNFDEGMIEWEALSNHPYPVTIIGSRGRSNTNKRRREGGRSNTNKRRIEGA